MTALREAVDDGRCTYLDVYVRAGNRIRRRERWRCGSAEDTIPRKSQRRQKSMRKDVCDDVDQRKKKQFSAKRSTPLVSPANVSLRSLRPLCYLLFCCCPNLINFSLPQYRCLSLVCQMLYRRANGGMDALTSGCLSRGRLRKLLLLLVRTIISHRFCLVLPFCILNHQLCIVNSNPYPCPVVRRSNTHSLRFNRTSLSAMTRYSTSTTQDIAGLD